MNKLIYFLLLLPLVWIDSSCTDQCTETRTFKQFTSVPITTTQVRLGVGVDKARGLVNPGKIYTKGGYLFINELKQGIHVIDNRNPSAPKSLAFISIPGNGDIAIRDNFLYADSYMDLVTFDISNLADIHEVSRSKNVFTQGQFDGGWWSYNPQYNGELISDQRVDYTTQTVKTNCENVQTVTRGWATDVFSFQSASADKSTGSSGGTTNGTSGSMARFALYDKYLYTIATSDMKLFDVQKPATPVLSTTISMGWGIETIFPYKDKLFIGSQSGMFIYDNANPAQPKQLSVFQHARRCDPVVVNDNTAYVTLRGGGGCGGASNQLDVVDITSLTSPKLLKSYPMRSPYGLGVDFPNLFVCEGAYGLKSFNAADPMQIDKNLQQYIDDVQAYDVIPMGGVTGQKTLLLIGRDGFYQYEYTAAGRLRLLSKIPVTRPSRT